MSAKVYNKLVRDNIPEIIQAAGKEPKTHILGDDEYVTALVEKLGEEYDEFKANHTIEELADMQEVILALAGVLNISPEQLEAVRVDKAADRGAFEQRIFLEEVS